MKKLHIGISLALLFLLFLSFGCTAPGGGQPKSFWMLGWDTLVWVAFATVLGLLSIGYMAASFTSNEEAKAWVKREIGQLFYSALILIFIVALVSSLDDWLKVMSIASSSIAGTPQWGVYVNTYICCPIGASGCLNTIHKRPCHIELATDYLQLLYETGRKNAIAALMNYQIYGFISNISAGIYFWIYEAQAGLQITPFAGLSPAADYFMLVFELMVKSMMLIRAQQVMLDFLNFPFFGVMLSMGIVLRILYFTRKLGGLLIAIALTMYIIFPMFYVVSHAILWGFMGWGGGGLPPAFGVGFDTDQMKLPYTDDVAADFSKDPKSVFLPANRINIDMCNSTSDPQGIADRVQSNLIRQNFQSSWGDMVGTHWYSKWTDFFTSGGATAGLGLGFSENGPIGTLATVLTLTLFLPFLAFMTALASIKVLSPLLGGDVEISVLSRLI